MVWAVDDGLPGLEHQLPWAAETGNWSEYPTIDERWDSNGAARPQGYPFWRNFEERPTEWIDDWEGRRDLEPVYRNWLRFRAVSGTDPWAEAARLLLLVDLGAWPAASRTHFQDRFIAPSIDVSCEFHTLAPHEGWYLLRGESPIAADGLVASHQEVRDSEGRLLASGVSHLLCRPVR